MIPCCFHPTRVIVIDDNHEFLCNLNQNLSKDNASYVYFTNPEKALHYLNKVYKPDPFPNRYLEPRDEDKWEHRTLDVNIWDTYCEAYRPERFEEISTVVVDYSMPGMSGLDVCKEIKDPSIQKILLTGHAEESIAIHAFNEGLIQGYIRKQDFHMDDLLNAAIEKAQCRYFNRFSEIVVKAIEIGDSQNQAVTDSKFHEFFKTLIIICKVANALLASLIFTLHSAGAMEGEDKPAKRKDASSLLRDDDFTAEESKETGGLKAQIRAEVRRILTGFENNMNAYYERTGNPKRISPTLPQLDMPERQYEQSEDDRHYSEKKLQELGEEIKWVLENYPLDKKQGAKVTTVIPETTEQEMVLRYQEQDRAEAGKIKVETLEQEQQRKAKEVSSKEIAQDKLEAEKAKGEMLMQERRQKAEEIQRQIAQQKLEAEETKAAMRKQEQRKDEEAPKQAGQDKLQAEKAKAEMLIQERRRKAEEIQRQIAQRKAEAEETKAAMCKQEQHKDEEAPKQTGQDKLQAEKAKAEMLIQERRRKAEEIQRQIAQRKAEETKAAMRKQEQHKDEEAPKQTGQDKLQAEKAKAEMLIQERRRKAEEIQRQIAQQKAEAETTKAENLKQQQHKADDALEQVHNL